MINQYIEHEKKGVYKINEDCKKFFEFYSPENFQFSAAGIFEFKIPAPKSLRLFDAEIIAVKQRWLHKTSIFKK